MLTGWQRGHRRDERSFPGYYIDSLEFRVDQFRIPPKELGEMMPQQTLMLRVAAESIHDACWDRSLGLRTGVLIGIGLDSSATNYHLRWSLADRARELCNSSLTTACKCSPTPGAEGER